MENQKTLQSVIRDKANLKQNAQHKNNGIKPVAFLFMLTGVSIIAGLMYTLLRVSTAPNGGVAPVATSVPLLNVSGMTGSIGTPRPIGTIQSFVIPVFVPSSTPVPQPTIIPSPTWIPSTPEPMIWLSMSTFWSDHQLRTMSGAWLREVGGIGLACPDRFPLGFEFRLNDGRKLMCVDRAGLTCSGTICRVVFYSPIEQFAGLYPAWYSSVPLNK